MFVKTHTFTWLEYTERIEKYFCQHIKYVTRDSWVVDLEQAKNYTKGSGKAGPEKA